MRLQNCREAIDWVLINCHHLSPDAAAEVKLASKFCKERAPYLEMQSTKAVNAIRVIKDPIIQGKVLEKVKEAIETRIDPRNGASLPTVAGVTSPMIGWIIQWMETGEKPTYVPRKPKSVNGIDATDILPLIDEILAIKMDRKVGSYPMSEGIRAKIKTFRDLHTITKGA